MKFWFPYLILALVRKIMSQEMEDIVSNETQSLYCGPESTQNTKTKPMAPSCKEEMYCCNIFFPLKNYINHLMLFIPPKYL